MYTCKMISIPYLLKISNPPVELKKRAKRMKALSQFLPEYHTLDTQAYAFKTMLLKVLHSHT